jgi:hypothetical protein
MMARVQRCDSMGPVAVAALHRTEVGDESGTMGCLGQAGREARWAVRWWRVLLGTLLQQGDDFSRGHGRALS